jgi:hypothetical protein
MNDKFKPIERARVIKRRKSLDFEMNEEFLQEKLKDPSENWHKPLNVRNISLL